MMAQRIPQEVIEDIRKQSNIVDVIGQYVQLKKSGKNFMGLCPFHDERSPSFSVVEDKQIYHCFGCGKGGNIFTFIQEIEGVGFPEAVSKVADLGHLEFEYTLPANDGRVESSQSIRETALISLHEKTAELYQHILLNTKAGEPALKYLEERGLTKEQIETFQIGFAPKERTILQQFFKKDQVPDDLLNESGLMIQRDNGDLLDRFYQRIMFPIKNTQGKIIAFSGRILAAPDFDIKEMPKYLNSPETTIFNKRLTLFHFNQARSEARKESELVLFEGFMDVIAAWGAGIKNGVASMGTSLTNEQIKMIQRVTSQVVICYDGDSAGIEATNRAVELLTENSTLDLSVISLPEKLDPDDYTRKYGPEAFNNLVRHGRETVFTFKMRYHKQGKNLQNEKEKLAYIQELLQELTKVPSVVEREMYVNQMAQEYQLSSEAINQELQSIKTEERVKERQEKRRDYSQQRTNQPPESFTPKQQQVQKIDRIEKAEQIILYRLMNERSVQSQLQQAEGFEFAHSEYQELYQHITDFMTLRGRFDTAGFLDYLQSEELRRKLIEITYLDLSEEGSVREIEDCLQVIALSGLEESIRLKKQQQIEASRNGNHVLELELAVALLDLQRKLKNR